MITSNNPLKVLEKFIKESQDNRELKRALAVKMFFQGCTLRAIANYLGVSFQFVGKWKNEYLKQGIQALKLGYRGSQSYLNQKEKWAIIHWLQKQQCCTLEELRDYIVHSYNVRFRSLQSYYQLFEEADMSFKKTQKVNPKRDPHSIAAKRYALKKVA